MQIDRLVRAIGEMKNPSALGLDTRLEFLPETFARKHGVIGAEKNKREIAEAIYSYNAALLGGLRDILPCVKIQAAYYERLGVDGIACMARTVAEARRLDYVVIVDAKRGDIGATSSAYSESYLSSFAPFPADFLTVNPYLGSDGIKPFIDDCERNGGGIFVLVKTSNPSSGEFQDLNAFDGRAFFEHVADRVSDWGKGLIGSEGYSSVGAVVGATYPRQGALLRTKLPHTFFLLPGYGVQGASAEGLSGCFDRAGRGAIVAASRSLLCSHKKDGTEDFVGAARKEALRMKEEIGRALRPGK